MTSTPTPPADTRQQAAEKGPLFDDLKQRMETLHVRWARHAARQAKTARETGYWDAVEACRIELRDVLACYPSSPALPEPPAPGREPDWRSTGEIGWLGDGYEVTVDPTPGVTPRLRFHGRVASASWLRGLRDAITAALAAADVAEEQQP